MRKQVFEILRQLGERAPWTAAAGWDPVGLQLGDPDAVVGRIGICHEVTEPVVRALEVEPVDLLISYHPLLFRPTTRLVAGATPAGRALRLVRSGVALGVAHTNFDVAKGGAADALAEALGLEQTSGFAALFGPDSVKLVTFVPADAADTLLEALAAAGAGVIGNYTHCSFRAEGIGSFFASEASDPAVGRRGELNREPEVRLELVAPRAAEAEVLAALVAAHPYEEPAYDVFDRRGDARMLGRVGALAEGTTLGDLAARVEEVLGSAEPRVAGDPERPIRRAAVLPGGGADALEAAAARGAEVLVTGDVSHHRARAAVDLGLALIDPGHAATERPGVERLLAWAASLGVECAGLLHLDPDPWRAPPE